MKDVCKLLQYVAPALLVLAGLSAAQAQSRTIELQTDEREDPLIIPLQDSPGLQLDSDGTVFATAEEGFVCHQGDSCEDVQVSLAEGDGGEFSLTESTVTQGVEAQIVWEARGAWDCTGTGLTDTTWSSDNPKQPRGSAFVATDDLSIGSHPVGLLCENGPKSATGSLTLTVEEAVSDPEGPEEGCDEITKLGDFSGWTRANDVNYPWGSSEVQTFESVFSTWPGTGNTYLIGIPKNEFLAVSFNSGPLTASSDGALAPELPQLPGSNIVGWDKFMVSYSKCPGDFDPDSPALAEGCLQTIRPWFDNAFWGGPGSAESCQLEADTDYYLNIVYTQDAVGTMPPTQAPCEGEPRCGNIFAPQE